MKNGAGISLALTIGIALTPWVPIPVFKPLEPIMEIAPVEGRPDYYQKLWLASCPSDACRFVIDCRAFSMKPHDCPLWSPQDASR